MATYTDSKKGTFDKCSSKIEQHVLNTCLAVKIANYMGISIKNVNDQTNIHVDSPYNNSEGTLKGSWVKGMPKGLRVDLQKEQNHNGQGYAAWMVQWGVGMGKKGGAYAGVLMLVNQNFTLGEFKTAMQKSFEYGSYCLLDP